MKLKHRIITSILLVFLLISMIPTAAFADGSAAAVSGNTRQGVDAMTEIESALSSKKRGSTVRVANDGYIGIPVEVSVYHAGGSVKAGYDLDATPIVIYVVNTAVARIGTDSDVSIINSMLDRGFVVVIFDYLNSTKAVSPDLDWSIQGLRPNVVKGTYFSGTGLPSGSYHNNMVVPAGYNIEFNHVFFEIDKHGADGLFEKTVEIWNNDFRSYHANKLVKWVDEDGNRKATQNGFDGTSPVWLDSKGNTSLNGEYVKVKHTKATKIEDCVKPDGTPIDMNLYMHVTYPTNPGYDVPVMALACSSSHLAGGTQTSDRPQYTGFALGGYATVTFDHGFFPMARTDHFDYYDGTIRATGSTGVTDDGGAYSLQHYDNVRIDTAAMRYIRYLSASNHEKYSFDSEAVGVFGNSKGGWITHLGEENPETGLARRIVPGYNGNSRYENGKTEDIVFGSYVIDGGEEQPWLSYNGVTLDSGADLVYAGCSGGQYTITSAHAPTYVSLQLGDSSFYQNSNTMVNACRTADIPTMWFEVSLGHTLASGPDMRYGVDTYNAFMDFCGYYLRGDAVKVEYVHREAEKFAGVPNNAHIIVKFTGAVSPSEIEKISVKSSDGSIAAGRWTALYGNTEWTFEPDTLDCDEVYIVTVPAGIEGDNGKPMPEDYTYEFRTGYAKANTGTTFTTSSGTYAYFTVPNPEDISFEAEIYTVRLYVSQNGVNALEVYPLSGFDPSTPESATRGALISTVPVSGIGQYDVDVTDYVSSLTPGTTAAFLIKQKKPAGETVVHSSPLTTNMGGCSVQTSKFAASIGTAPDGTMALQVTEMKLDTSHKNNYYYYNPNIVFTNTSIIKSGALTNEDLGRTFVISLRVYDTTSRIITIEMNKVTSSSAKLNDYNISYYNLHTKANEWVEFSFVHTVYEPLYANLVGNKTQRLIVSIPSMGTDDPGIYFSDVKAVEIVTDVTVERAELVVGTTKQRTNPLATEYGTIPTIYESVEDYPYVLFDAKGNCVGAGTSLTDSGIGLLLTLQDNTPPLTESDHVLLVRRDMSFSPNYSNFGFIQGKLTIDLLGNSLTCTERLFNAQAKRSGTLNVTVKNGTLLQKKYSLIDVSSYTTENYTYETTGTRTFNFVLENVTLGYAEGASAIPFVSTSGTSTYPVKSSIKLKDCTFDLITNAPGGSYMLFKTNNDSNYNSSVSVEVIGGSLVANSLTGITIGRSSGNGSFKFSANKNGRNMTVLLPESAAAPMGSYEVDDEFVSFIALSTENGKTLYRLNAQCPHTDEEKNWQTENGMHYRVCSYCLEEVDREECRGGKADCAHGAVCSYCKNEYTAPDPNVHTTDGNWTSDGVSHSSSCKNGCGAIITEACYGGVANCRRHAICRVCKNDYGELLPHTYDSDCDDSCNACRAEREAPHSFGELWQTDSEKHWQTCSCGAKGSTGNHLDEDSNSLCDTCEYQLPKSEPDPIPDPSPTGSNGGLIIGVCVGGGAVLGLLALWWFVLRKKKPTA